MVQNQTTISREQCQFFFFLISNKNSLILKKRHPSTQGVYMGEQVKNENREQCQFLELILKLFNTSCSKGFIYNYLSHIPAEYTVQPTYPSYCR